MFLLLNAMLSEFQHYLASCTGLPEDLLGEISRAAIPATLRRREALLEPRVICHHKVFIVSGLLRTYAVTPDGNEHILQFSPENTWTLDVESYDRQVPSLVTIEAIEPSRVLLWQKVVFDDLLARIPELKRFSEQLISRNIHASRSRILTMLGATPEEKYDDFVRSFPAIQTRLPLRMIAAYLGISLKTLTRIRHAQLRREAGIVVK